MRLLTFLAVLAPVASGPATLHSAPGIPNDDAAITHALNRLAFGPRPGDIERVRAMGLAEWMERQLRPARIEDDEVDRRVAGLETLRLDSTTIARQYFLPAMAARRARQQRAGASSDGNGADPAPSMRRGVPRPQRVIEELSEAKLLRAVYGERQLEEVLVDFWFNHFNVFARKGRTGMYVGEYERDAIRPHVLGRFRTLLEATAKSPAMLFYLDNWQSAAPADRVVTPAGRARGLNENYARELLELHTLGVDGGYTQADIVAVARAFTGWTIGRPGGAGFRFARRLHDHGMKVVLGHTIPAGGGIEDGERVLDILARHPATARHIAFELAQRFVSDTPPPSLVDKASATFLRTDGDLREVVRTIVTSPEFFGPAVRQAKVKTPFEYVASVLRASNADVQQSRAVLRALAGMGMPLYLCQPPTGYDDTADAWVSSGALVARINFAVALTSGRVPGVRLPARARADALALGSAEFQRQ